MVWSRSARVRSQGSTRSEHVLFDMLGVQAITTALGKGSADQSIVHDEIPMEAEAAQYQQKFDEFLAFFNYKDKKGNDRNKITDLFSGGRKDDEHIIDQLKQYKSE